MDFQGKATLPLPILAPFVSGGPVLKEIICFYRSTEGSTLKRKNLLL